MQIRFSGAGKRKSSWGKKRMPCDGRVCPGKQEPQGMGDEAETLEEV